MPWSVKRRVIVSCSIGWTLTILGAVMIPVLEWVIKKKVESVGTNQFRVPTSSGKHGKTLKKCHAWKNHGI